MCKKAILLVSYVILLTGMVGNVFADTNASAPSPSDGATAVQLFPMVTLTWTPGAYVAPYVSGPNGNGHHVFFHTRLNYVTGAGTSYPLGTTFGHYRSTSASFDPSHCIIDAAGTYGQTSYGNPLPQEKTFYWRIFEINNADTTAIRKGPTWSFTTLSERATNPGPAIGTEYFVDSGQTKDVSLSWTRGPNAASTNGHDVYLGTSSATVTSATTATTGIYKGRQTPTSYAANALAAGYTYYWRIDEVNGATIWPGNIWNFKVTVNYPTGLVEDFNDNTPTGWAVGNASYTLTEANQVMRIVANKSNDNWASFTYSFALHNISSYPRLTVRVKANKDFNLNMSVYDSLGGSAYPNGDYTEIVASGDYEIYSFNFAGVTGVDLTRVVSLNFVFNPGAPGCSTTAWFDDLKIGSSSSLTPSITEIPTQNHIINAPRQTIPFRGVSNGAGGTSGITITATSSNLSLIPNPTVEYTAGSSSGYIKYTPVADQNGTATVAVTVSAPATAPADKVLHFDVEVEKNMAPEIDQVADSNAKAGEQQVVELTGIDDGNPNGKQAITVTARSSNPSLIPDPTVDYNSDDSFGTLTYTPTLGHTGTAAITVTVQDNGGTVNGGEDTSDMVFDVNVYENLNNLPTIDPIGNVSVFWNVPEQTVPLTGISDGDGGTQTVTITATSSNTGLVPNPTIVYTSPNSTGQLKFTPVAGQTGTVTITVTVSDNGGAPNNNGDKSIQKTFNIQVRLLPSTGFWDDFSSGVLDPNWSNGEGCHDLTEVGGVLNIFVDKTRTNNVWAGLWYGLPKELDISQHPYISITMRTVPNAPYTNNEMLIFLWDHADHYNTAGTVHKFATANFVEYYFDFTGLNHQGDGAIVDFTRIKALLFNFAPGQMYIGTWYFDDLRVGDQAHIAGALTPKVKMNSVPDYALAKNCGVQDVNLTGISDGDKGNYTVAVTAASSNHGLIPDPCVSAVSDGKATLTYTPNTDQTGRATITVTSTATGSDPNVMTFIVDVLNRAGSAVTVNVSQATTYQEIDGLGAFLYDMGVMLPYVQDIGMSMCRTFINGFEPSNDNSDPNIIDFKAFNYSAFPTDTIKVLKSSSSVDKVILTMLTPENWMKKIKWEAAADWATDNILMPSSYAEYGEEIVALIKAVKAVTGVDVYAISLQNEPEFNEFYGSCVIKWNEYRDLVKVVGPRLKAEGLKTKLFFPEALQQQGHVGTYIQTMNADPAARQYIDIAAVHNYDSDGIHVGGTGAGVWTQIYNWAQEAPAKKTWMSETSDVLVTDPNWFDGITLACNIYNAMYYGKISAWVYYDLSLMLDVTKTPNPRYYASKHYYKYIRPGAIRVGCTSANSDVLALAFSHPTNKTVTLVLINTGTNSHVVNVTGSVLPATFASYTSSNHRNFEQNADVTDGLLLLPPSSITTLYGTTTATLPPDQARDPSPVTGAPTAGTTSVLSWTAGATATSHDVYFGTSSPGTSRGNQAGTTYNPGTLTAGTNYYWRIDEKNAGGTTGGIVWMFTTSTGGSGDFNGDGRENFIDFAIFANAWKSQQGQANWNAACDIASPKDNIIDWKDLSVFAGDWLKGY